MSASVKDVYDFFGKRPGETLKDFTAEWQELTEQDKEQIKTGIGNDSLTY